MSAARRLLRAVGFGVAGMLVLISLLYVFRSAVFGKAVADLVRSTLADELGGDFTVGSIGGNWFSEVVVAGIESKGELDPPFNRLNIERAEVSYRLAGILAGEGAAAVTSVKITGLDLELDLTRPKDTAIGESSAPAAFPAGLPRIDIEGRVDVLTGEGRFRLLRAALRGSGRTFDLSLAALELPPPWKIDPAPVQARLDISPHELTWTSESTVAGLELRRLTLSTAQTLRLTYRIGIAGGEIAGVGDESIIDARIDRVSLDRVPAWIRSLPGSADAIPSRGLLDGAARVRAWNASPAVEADLGVSSIVWAGVGADLLKVKGEWTGTVLRLEHVDAKRGATVVVARGAVVDPQASSAFLVQRLDSLSVDSRDPATLAAELGQARLASMLPQDLKLALQARRPQSGALVIESVTAETDLFVVEAAGAIDPRGAFSTWRDFQIHGTVRSRTKAPAERTWDGSLTARAGQLEVSGGVRGTLGLPAGDFDLSAKGVTIAGEAIDALTVKGGLDWPALVVQKLDAAAPGGRAQLSGTKIDLDTSEVAGGAFQIDLRDVDILRRLIPDFPDIRGQVAARGTIQSASRDGIAMRASIAATGVSIASREVGKVDADVVLAGRNLQIDTIAVQSSMGSLTARGSVVVAPQLQAAADLEFTLHVPRLAALGELEPGLAALRGAATVAGRLRKAAGATIEAASVGGTVALEDAAFDGWEIGAGKAELQLAWPALALSKIHVSGPNGRISGEALIQGDALMRSSGRLEIDLALDAALARRFDPKAPELAGSVRVQGDVRKLQDQDWIATAARLSVASDDLRIESVRIQQLSADVDRSAASLDVSNISLVISGAKVDADLAISSLGGSPTFKGRIEARGLPYREQILTARASFEQSGTELAVRELSIDAGSLGRLDGRGRLPPIMRSRGRFEVGALETAAFVVDATFSDSRTLGLDLPVSIGDVKLHARLDGKEGSVTISGKLAGIDERRAVSLTEAFTAEARFSPRGAEVVVQTAENGPVQITARLDSKDGFDWTAFDGILDRSGATSVTGSIVARVADLSAWQPFVPVLRSIGGRAEANIAIAGTLASPLVQGHLALDALVLKFADPDIPGIDDGVARLRFSGREVVLETLSGRAGYAPIDISGRATFERLDQPTLDFKLTGQNVLIARSDDLRLRADVDATVRGTWSNLEIAGKTRVTDAIWSQPMDLSASRGGPKARGKAFQAFSFRSPPLSTARFDLELTTTRGIRVDNNLVDGVLSAELTITGPGEAPRLAGRIASERATVRLPFTRLEVERAEIVFREADAYQPRIDAVAMTRLRGHELTVRASGIIPDVDVKVASLPPLSQRDAYLLLTTGISPGELERGGVTGATLNRAGSLVGTELLSQFSSASSGQSVLDRFTLDVGREESQRGQPTVETEVQLSKQFYLRAERDRFDEHNIGFVWRVRFR